MRRLFDKAGNEKQKPFYSFNQLTEKGKYFRSEMM